MIYFFQNADIVYAVGTPNSLNANDKEKLNWLFGGASLLNTESIEGTFIGPRREMITPWSTNAVEISLNMGLNGLVRIERFERSNPADLSYDPMLEQV